MLAPTCPSRRSTGASPTVAIVGGGAAGLAVARQLRQREAATVTVFEREARVGGKCCSLEFDGVTTELGAALVAPGYREVRRLLRELRLETRPISTSGVCGLYDLRSGRPRAFSRRERVRLGLALLRFFAARRTAGDWSRPGVGHLAAALGEPFEMWLRRRSLHALQEPLEAMSTAYGYGYSAEIPAAYLLKYFEPSWTTAALLGRGMHNVEGGYQTLVQRMAAGIDVRLETPVARLESEPAGVWVHPAAGGPERFDAVVVAVAPLPEAFFAAVDAQVAELFAAVRHYPYHALAAPVHGLPGSVVYVPEHFQRRAGENRLVFGYQRHPDQSPVGVLTALAGPGVAAAEVETALRADAGRLGAAVGPALAYRTWRYFPHFGPAAFRAGAARRLEQCQGRGGVFFAGELLSFPTVEHVCRQARQLVDTQLAAHLAVGRRG